MIADVLPDAGIRSRHTPCADWSIWLGIQLTAHGVCLLLLAELIVPIARVVIVIALLRGRVGTVKR